MRYRSLGRSLLQVSEIGYGTWGMGGDDWRGGSDEESLAALRRALELGLNFIDTALVYGEGHSERLVGQALRESSKKVYVASKVPPMNRKWPARPGVGIEQVFPYYHIVESTESSLRNLGLETIDLQQLHVWNPEWAGEGEWYRAIEDLKRAGKVRFAGISVNSNDPDSALGLVQTGLIDSVQVIYNIFDQRPVLNLLPLCQEQRVGVIVRCPLDEGALTGTITENAHFEDGDYRARYFRGDRKAQVAEKVTAILRDLPDAEGTIAEVALRFCLSHPAVCTVIPGMRKPKNAEANCSVSDKGPLDQHTLAVLRRHAWDKNFRA